VSPAAPTGSPTELLASWIGHQRWFAGKGTGATPSRVVRSVGEVTLGEDASGAVVRLHLVETGGTLYQVPLSYHPAPVADLACALVGITNLDGTRARWVYDAAHDPLFLRAVLRTIARDARIGGRVGDGGVRLRGVRQHGGVPIEEAADGSVLRGEQSNTSIVVSADTPQALIVKVFRVLAAGDNPDVVVPSALAAAGCTRVPQPAGWLEGSWERDGVEQRGHLAVAVEFLGGSEDAWRVATRAVASGASFAEPAADLGVATAEVHEHLAAALPARPAGPQDLARIVRGLHDRLDWALAQVPDLAGLVPAARERIEGAARTGTAGLRLQRIHGDYHLGQVLHAPGRGWVLLDFEGEPLRPLPERSSPDLALRDVAGMLRSFDYAAGYATVHHPEDTHLAEAARAWADEARAAFLRGYAACAGLDLTAHAELLAALEVDKALYEVVYETRNRPDWLTIPATALRRLLTPAGATDSSRPS
jgi:trehalose synthase-fused probable maltokinase